MGKGEYYINITKYKINKATVSNCLANGFKQSLKQLIHNGNQALPLALLRGNQMKSCSSLSIFAKEVCVHKSTDLEKSV